MSRIPLLFVATAAACMVAGVALGIGMGMLHDFQLAPVHAHLNLVGWSSLALMGLIAQAWPELAEGRIAWLQFALSAGSGVLFPPGIYLAVVHDTPLLAIVAGIAWFAGALLLLGRVLRLMVSAPARRARHLLAAE